MHPELFKIPFTEVTVKSYGTMIVIGFFMAMLLMRKCAKKAGQNPDHISNVALYALVAGIIGARIFYVAHYFSHYKDNLLSVFAIWQGGLEFLGGVLFGLGVMFYYLYKNKLPMRMYFDFLAIGLMIGLAFGRIGCFFNGCCFGKPTESVIGVRFPYGSPACYSQAFPNEKRNRLETQLDLPKEYYGFLDEKGRWEVVEREEFKYQARLKPKELLTEKQEIEVTTGKYKCLAVWPTQLISSANAFFICGILYLVWRTKGLVKQGVTFSLAMVLYGIGRFLIEMLRDDSPFETAWWAIYQGGTISQNIAVYMFMAGIAGLVYFGIIKKNQRATPAVKEVRNVTTTSKRKKR